MRRTLTDRGIAALKPEPGKRKLTHDLDVPGLAVMVTEKGAKSFVLYTRFPGSGKPTRRFIGTAGALPLAAAREKARHWRALIAQGKDPAEHEAAQRAAEARQRANSFAAVTEAYLEEHVKGQRTATATEQDIRSNLIPRWGSRPIASITVNDVLDLCADFKKAGIGAHGHNVLGHARRIFKWAIRTRRYELERSPCADLEPSVLISKKKSRDRTLTDAEIRALWLASDTLGYPYGPLYKLLLLTGTRRDEAAHAVHQEFDLSRKLWIISAGRHKSERDFVIPLSEDALSLLDGLPRLMGPFLFSTTGGQKAINGFSKAKRQLNELMQRALGEPLRPFQNHDIRRTVRSRLSELKVSPVVAEVTIGHKLPGLLGVYDRFDYLEEKRDALERWAQHLRGIVSRRGNIIEMRARP
jgi:integrase